MRYKLVLPVGLDLRIAEESDEAFMERLFGLAHDYFYAMNVPEQYVNAIVKQQYQLQKNSYQHQWPEANTFIIRWCGQSIGLIIIYEEQGLLHFIDCAFVPEKRGKGYGTSILRTAQALAREHQLLLKLSVEKHNQRAKKLYLSVGFEVVEESASHDIMTWRPPVVAAMEHSDSERSTSDQNSV